MKNNISITKRTIAAMFILLCVLFVTSCEKDSADPAISNSVKGLWEGTMTDANTQPFFLSIKSNGTCTSENISPGTQENLSYGTWTLTGTTLVCTLQCVYGYVTNIGLQMTFTGTYDSNAGTINGSFHLVSPSGATDDGTFALVETE